MQDQLGRLKTALEDRYAIQDELGAGGMATVYLAEDLKHRRKVAVKVLRPELAAIIGAERFLKEIEVTANLQHPHILPLHDSGEADSFLYYVMPYVEGESLRDKLHRDKQLSVDETVDIAKGVAAALDYAHRQGVIHRDIKPENILVHDGQPVVADFGIALAVTTAGGTRLTETGLSLGTPQYMSPEQATGEREVNARSDVYSLGAVVYEMLVGDPPHTGSTVQAIVAKVVSAEPDPITDVRHTVPVHMDSAVQKALAKVPADRFERASEFAAALSGAVVLPSRSATRAPAHAIAVPKWLLAANVVALAALLVWGLLPPSQSHGATHRSTFRPEPPNQLSWNTEGAGYTHRVRLSRDGSKFVYAGGDPRALFVQDLNTLNPTELSGSQDGYAAAFSPEGEWIAFAQGGLGDQHRILKMRLADEVVTVVATAPRRTTGISWGDDDYIYIGGNTLGVMRAPTAGGELEQLTTPESGVSHSLPELLPGGNAVIFTSAGSTGREVWVVSLDSKVEERVVPGRHARYVETGHLVFIQPDGILAAAPFDLESLTITGAVVAVLDDVDPARGPGDFAVSENGTLAYVAARPPNEQLQIVDRRGRIQGFVSPDSGLFFMPRFSRDGDQVAALKRGAGAWIYGAGASQAVPGTTGINSPAAWGPNDDRLLITGRGPAPYVSRLDGAPPEPLMPGTDTLSGWAYDWSTDGRFILLSATGGLGYVSLEGNGAKRMLRQEAGEGVHLWGARFSPNDRFVSYHSNETGRDEVYVIGFPNGSSKWQVSVGGGRHGVWGPSGNEFFYTTDGKIMAVDVEADGTTFHSGDPRELFKGPYNLWPGQPVMFDVHPDSDRFVMITANVSEIVVVHNWFEELTTKMTN